jgi:hypothetical protein
VSHAQHHQKHKGAVRSSVDPDPSDRRFSARNYYPVFINYSSGSR